jgi:hypothetical protein
MTNYGEAQIEWQKALSDAGNDEAFAERLLLARPLRELMDQSSRMHAYMEAMNNPLSFG